VASNKWAREGFNWGPGLFIIGYHVGLAIGLPLYFASHRPALGVVVSSIVILILSEIGIGAAYHRFYSHRCFKLNRVAEAALLFLGTVATQGSVLRWSCDHRNHHAHVDTDLDPYSINKGFFFAHMGWLFEKSKPIDERIVQDLMKNPLVRFQHRHANALSIGSNAGLWLLFGWLFNDFLGAFVLLWWTRLALSHHLTWFINSLAHTWGSKTYSREHTAVDNFVVAMLTVGEGYHNYHHTFPSDYRNGVKWFHFDPTKWTIFLLSKVGLASGLKRYDEHRIKNRLLDEDHRRVIEQLKASAQRTREELGQRADELAARIHEKLAQLAQLMKQLESLDRKKAYQDRRRQIQAQLRELKQSMRRDWKDWYRLCDSVLADAPA